MTQTSGDINSALGEGGLWMMMKIERLKLKPVLNSIAAY